MPRVTSSGSSGPVSTMYQSQENQICSSPGQDQSLPDWSLQSREEPHYSVRPHFSITGFSNGPARQRWSRAAMLVKSYREAHSLSPPCRVFGCENASQLALLSNVPETLLWQGGHVSSPRAPPTLTKVRVAPLAELPAAPKAKVKGLFICLPQFVATLDSCKRLFSITVSDETIVVTSGEGKPFTHRLRRRLSTPEYTGASSHCPNGQPSDYKKRR